MTRSSLGIPFIGLLVGMLMVYLSPATVPPQLGPYLSLAALAGMDSIFGGIRAGFEGKFHDDIFISGFFLNALLAGLLAYLGDRIGVDLFLAAVVVLGWRVFTNLSLIRRYWLTQMHLANKKDA